jgi:hypothetical protein
MGDTPPVLYLRFHGRIIDSLGIQMYQRPVAAIAELISNSWDADATRVEVTLPKHMGAGAVIVIRDDGLGMSLAECQKRYLNVGQNRRVETGEKTPGGRPVLGRKGIGKFAGFGIAEIVDIDTVSAETGERTVFRLDLNELRSDDDQYVSTQGKEIAILEREGPDKKRKSKHGTTVTLRKLKLGRRPPSDQFRESMARRFLLAQSASDFAVLVDDQPLPDSDELAGVEFEFPRDYEADEKPDGVTVKAGWGAEELDAASSIRWRVRFTKEPIQHEELRGVSVFCRGKLAQAPFFFDLSGGLGGQLGQQYLSGQIEADYLDDMAVDVITTERQRVNWELPETAPLLEWGQERVKKLLQLWKERRATKKIRIIEGRLQPFAARLKAFPQSERKIVERALKRIGSIEALSDDQFVDLATALVTAWEGGKLKELIEQVASVDEMDADGLVRLLAEEQVLSALHIAETVRAKIEIIRNLEKRIHNKELELAVRDFIAMHPWLISPRWETYKIESRVDHIMAAAAKAATLEKIDDWKKRVDLVLSSGEHLLVIEFMRPGLTIDRDHLDRFAFYVDEIRTAVRANTGLGFRRVSGLLVADGLSKRASVAESLQRLAQDDMHCLEWPALLSEAEAQWRDFLNAVRIRAPEDSRIKALAQLTEKKGKRTGKARSGRRSTTQGSTPRAKQRDRVRS